MSGKENHNALEHCPNCGISVRAESPGEGAPAFCLRCRFPLMTVAGKYRLVRVLGEGGFATVYEARHITMPHDPQRVVKVLKPELLSEEPLRARFLREVQITSKLSQRSQHIIRIFDDFGELPNFGTFYVMEFLDGRPLSELIDESQGLLSVELCLHFFGQLCEAMEAAHQEGIVHRDLKPDNLFVIQHEQDPHWLKVIDFGIAKPVGNEEAVTKLTQGAMGTPAYMAPELYLNQEVGPGTDLYAMGIVLFELLAGFTPFAPPHLPAPTAASFMTSHLMQEPPSLSSMLPAGREVPSGFEGVIQKALQKKPADRFASVAEMREAFVAAQQTPPLLIEGRGGRGAAPAPLEASAEVSLWGKPAVSAKRFYPPTDPGAPISLEPEVFDELVEALSPDYSGFEPTVVQPAAEVSEGVSVAPGNGAHVIERQTEENEEPPAAKVLSVVAGELVHVQQGRAISSALMGPPPFLPPSMSPTSEESAEGTSVSAPPEGLKDVLAMAPHPEHEPMTREDLPASENVLLADELSPSHDLLEILDEPGLPLPSQAPVSRRVPLWLLVVGGLVLVGGVGGLWAWSASEDPLVTSGKRHKAPSQPTLPTAVRSAHTHPRLRGAGDEVPQVASSSDAGPRDRSPLRGRATKPKLRRRVRPRRRWRRSFSRRFVSGCPRLRRYHWRRLRLPRRMASEVSVTFEGRGRYFRRRFGLCLGARRRSTKVILRRSGYSPCTFTFKDLRSRHKVRLVKPTFGIDPSAPDYCILKK